MTGRHLYFVTRFFLVVFLICVVEGKSSNVCKCGWTFWGDHCYYFSNTTLDWYDAAAYCRHYGGYLVKINNKNENSFIQTYSTYLGRYNKDIASHGIWIGGHDFTEGKWRWDADNTKFHFSDFATKQPDGSTQDEDCLQLLGLSKNFKWNDFDCNKSKHYACEKSLNTDPCVCHTR